MMPRLLAAVAATALVSAAPSAGAHEAYASGDAPVVTKSQAPSWYGWQLLATDVAGAGLFLGALWTLDHNLGTPMTTGLVLWGFAPLVIHTVHDAGTGTILGSLGMRLGLPVAGALMAYGAGEALCTSHCDGGDAAVWGALLGAAAATALDVALLSWSSPPSATRRRASLSPMPLKSRGGLMLGGTF